MTPGGRSEGYHDAEVSTRRSELNGERFLMVRSGTAAETLGLVVVEHWFEELKRLVPVP